MSDESECTCGIPKSVVVLRELRITEILDPEDGEIYKLDLSHNGSGDDLPLAGVLELSEWAKAIATAPFIADIVHQYVFGDAEDE